MGLVDVHCHILPELDDGARSLADSVAMARQAQADGIAVVCATPHIRDDHDVRIHELPARVAALGEELEREGVPVRVVPGGEIGQHAAGALSPAELHALSLGGGGWVLLEPAPGPLGAELEGLVEHLAEQGVRTILAHPERHAGADLEERLLELVARGALIQWTAEFIAKDAGGEFVRRLARDGLVHLLGSDSHSALAGRPVRLSEGHELLADVLPPARVRWIALEAPWAVLRGEALTPPW
ncbi:MAG TPA: CpsB/CapC family capsule biosynthesis tyrosine phosphatase [Solirubrobacteraceae bacterium]|jgi:protein-tyrosine phosphatase